MDNNQHGLPSFSPEQVRKVLGTREGQQLLQILNRDGGTALRQAAAAVKAGDYSTAQNILAPMMQTPEAAKLVNEINRK